MRGNRKFIYASLYCFDLYLGSRLSWIVHAGCIRKEFHMDSMPRHLLEKWAKGSRPNNKNRGSDNLMVYFTSDMHFGHRAIIAMMKMFGH